MTRNVTAASMLDRYVVATLVAALLSIGALMAMSPSTASAADNDYVCDPGEFCLGYGWNLTGGRYDNQGNDSFLPGDRYFYFAAPNEHLSPLVAYLDESVKPPRYRAQSLSAYNNGRPHYRDDVMVYTWFNYTGHKGCIRRGTKLGALPPSWRNRIMSLKWVTDSECSAAPRL